MNNLYVTDNQIADIICAHNRLPVLTYQQLTTFLKRVSRVYGLTSVNSLEHICECAALFLKTQFGRKVLKEIVNKV